MSEALPPPDPARIAATAPRRGERRTLRAGTLLVRIHPLAGPHPCAWDELRHFGPLASRFDHHPEPQGHHPDHGVGYFSVNAPGTANAFVTAMAEAHQAAGSLVPIQLNHPERRFVTISRTRLAIAVLDLGSAWITRAGGNAAICSGPRTMARQWAEVIHSVFPDLQGLLYPSSIYPPGRCLVLWERGRPALSPAPLASRSLADLEPAVRAAAEELGTVVV